MSDNPLAAFGGGTGLVSREEMAAYLNSAAAAVPASNGGKQFLKISDKDGVWTFGAEETVVEDGALWAVNPTSFFHGYIAWLDGKPDGEHRSSVRRPLPSTDSLKPTKAPKGYEKQVGFDLVCINGDDAGTVCEYKASSVGGTRAVGNLVNSLNEQFGKNPDALVAIVRLKDNEYYDTKYKKAQFPPVFEVVEWRTMGDTSAPVAATTEPEAPPARTRARTAAPVAASTNGLADQDNDEDDAPADVAPEAEATPRRRMRR